MSPVDVHRLLHTNYNCVDLDRLERWYTGVLAVDPVMRSTAPDEPGVAFGLRMRTSTRALFLYDHRGPRRTSSLELVQWISPPTVGSPYPDPWDHGIQSCAYAAPDLDAVARAAVELGGDVVARDDQRLLLRDPERLWVEVYAGAVERPEQRHLRVVVGDLDATTAWWGLLGFTEGDPPPVPGPELWPHTDGRTITAERPLVATDDRTLSVLLTRWSGPEPEGPSYGAPFHQGLYRFALAVDDVWAAYETLRAQGLTAQPPCTFQLPGTKLTDGLTILFLRDPNGILVELVHRPRAHFERG
jgi:catechol 2,3-dioxygenase-like lactoylglutathione lyase family enzyme